MPIMILGVMFCNSIYGNPIIITYIFVLAISGFYLYCSYRFYSKKRLDESLVFIQVIKGNAILAIPLISIYMLRTFSEGVIIFGTIFVILLVIGIYLGFKKLNISSNKFAMKFLSVGSIVYCVSMFLIIFNIFPGSYFVKALRSNLSHYKSENVLQIETDYEDLRVVDFIYDDDYLYFIVKEGLDDYLVIYDCVNEVYLSRENVRENYISLDDNILRKGDNYLLQSEGDNYYLSYDGIYTFNQGVKIKISDIPYYRIVSFKLNNGKSAFATYNSDKDYDIYTFNDESIHLELTYENPDNNYFMYSITDTLLIYNNSTKMYNFLGKTPFVPDISFLDISVITKNKIVINNFSQLSLRDDIVEIYSIENETMTDFTDYRLSFITTNTIIDGYYARRDIFSEDKNMIIGLYDDDLELQNTIYLPTSKRLKSTTETYYHIRVDDGKVYYLVNIDDKGDSFIEIHELIEKDLTLEYDYYKQIDILFIGAVFIALWLPSNPKQSKRSKIDSNTTNKEDREEEVHGDSN